MYVDWRFEQHDTDTTWPTRYRDCLLLGVGTAVCCVEQNSGRLKWESTVESDITVKPSAGGDRGFVIDSSGSVYAYDSSTGNLHWRKEVDGDGAIPTITDGNSVIVSTTDTVASLDADTGEYGWECQLPTGPSGPPAVTDDTIYTGTEDGIVYAISPTDGTIQWELAVDAPLTRAGVTIENETLYVPTAPIHSERPGAIHALDTTAREVCWTVNTPATTNAEAYQASPPVIHDGTVYLLSGDGESSEYLQAIRDGEGVWSASMEYTSSLPAVVDGIVLVSTLRELLAFDRRSGDQLKIAEGIQRLVSGSFTETISHGAPIFTEQSVIIRGSEELVAISPKDGRLIDGADGSIGPVLEAQVPELTEQSLTCTSSSRVSYPSTTSRATGDATIEWGFCVGHLGGSLLNPMLVDDTVYLVSTDGVATALDAEEGTVQWLTELDGRFERSPLVADGTLFLVRKDNILTLDPQDGSVRSRTAALPDDPRQPTGQVATPVDDVVSARFTPDLENVVVTVATDDDTDNWQFEDELRGRLKFWEKYYAQLGDTLFVGLMFKPGTTVFYALDSKTESVQFRLVGNPGGGVDVFAPPIVHDGRLFVTCSDRFYAVDLPN